MPWIKRAQAPEPGTGREVTILRPLGLHPRLPDAVADIARETAETAGQSPEDCTLLLVAHGSRHDDASRRATAAVGNAIERTRQFAGVALSFLEEQPLLDHQIRTLEGPLIAAGLFAGEGMHGTEDLSAATQAVDRNDLFVAAPLTRHAGLLPLLKNDLERLQSH